MTDNLLQRIWQHKNDVFPGFAKQYGVKMLVWYEQHDTREAALRRERQIKKWNRSWKLQLIERINPTWRDLYDEIAA
jgi:putative endonuclease